MTVDIKKVSATDLYFKSQQGFKTAVVGREGIEPTRDRSLQFYRLMCLPQHATCPYIKALKIRWVVIFQPHAYATLSAPLTNANTLASSTSSSQAQGFYNFVIYYVRHGPPFYFPKQPTSLYLAYLIDRLDLSRFNAFLAEGAGFEPTTTESKSVVIPASPTLYINKTQNRNKFDFKSNA